MQIVSSGDSVKSCFLEKIRKLFQMLSAENFTQSANVKMPITI